MMTRRNLISGVAAVAAGMILKAARPTRADDMAGMDMSRMNMNSPPSTPTSTAHSTLSLPDPSTLNYLPVEVPNGTKLPWKMVDGCKVFHMVAEEVTHEFLPGFSAICWGYNGAVHGPVIEAVEGDEIKVFVTNRLIAPTTVHWHGVILPNGMDGVGGLTQIAIQPGETFLYHFKLVQAGTFMYHSHHDEMTQMALGMVGMFIIHPKASPTKNVERDFALMIHEWRVTPGMRRPDPTEMTDFNLLTINAKAFPATQPLVAKKGQRVRIRLGNLGAMDHHPMHLHGHEFELVESDSGVIPPAARFAGGTVLVPVGSTRVIEFTADNPGDWAFHCHMTHHVMNQMGHGIPNMIGVDMGDVDEKIRKLIPGYMSMGQAGMAEMGHMEMPDPPNSRPMLGGKGPHDYITMGGMFTILKVRETLSGYADPGWYEKPAGTLASKASADDLKACGIDVAKPPLAQPGGAGGV